jgi:hypothetical protein
MGTGRAIRRAVIGGAVLAALTLAPIASPSGADRQASPEAGKRAVEDHRAAKQNARLRGFGSCVALRRYARRHEEAVSHPTTGDVVMPPVGAAPGDTAGAGSEAGGGSAPSSTPTNVQEPGIDEPDIVKADGSLVFAIAGSSLRAIDVSGDSPRELDRLGLGHPDLGGPPGSFAGLLRSGQRLLLLSEYHDGAPSPGPGPAADIAFAHSPKTAITEIDVSDPEAMRVVSTLRVEGGFVSARQIGSTARIVVSSFPAWPATAERGSRARQIIPSTELTDQATGSATSRRLIPCRKIRRPREFSGLEMLSVLTIDVGRGLEPTDVDTIMTRGETVYSSPEALYVATQEWVPGDASDRSASGVSTAIHKFALDSPIQTRYAASGAVPGFMLSQWALSERDGLLRTASTTESESFEAGERESFVSVLEQRGGRLETVGRVGGLGRGERIYAVRFIEDVAYVVTFREVDPLYTVDLSDPTSPRLMGELKVPGYSDYLHPVGDDLLLGIGQDATEQGGRRGALASLFDVSDLATPASLDRHPFGENSYSEVEYDHHAFFFDPTSRLAVLPLEAHAPHAVTFTGAVGLRVGPEGIDEIARISHPDGDEPGGGPWRAIRRTLIVGDRLVTVGESGIATHDRATLATRGYLAFD